MEMTKELTTHFDVNGTENYTSTFENEKLSVVSPILTSELTSNSVTETVHQYATLSEIQSSYQTVHNEILVNGTRSNIPNFANSNTFLQPTNIHPTSLGFVNGGSFSSVPCSSLDPTHVNLQSTTYSDQIYPILGFQEIASQGHMSNYMTYTHQPQIGLQQCFNTTAKIPEVIDDRIYKQLHRCPHLPLDAHRKIRLMGNQIINYFEAKLIHVESPSQVCNFDAHLVFLKSPSTFQHWVMAFAKDQNRVVVKFNRLLTVHVKVSLQNPLTIEIEPSKSPNRRCDDEQFIFNFENQRVCAEFLRVLNICKKEVWTRREQDMIPHPCRSIVPTIKFQPTGRTRSVMRQPKEHESNQNDDIDPLSLNAFGDLELSPRKKFKPIATPSMAASNFILQKIFTAEEQATAPPKFMRFPYRMKFIQKHNAILSLRKDCKDKMSQEYAQLGMGTLKIWGNDDSFDQLDFIGKNNQEIICSHPIYSWNRLNFMVNEETDEFYCTWNAAADILNAPTTLPMVRNFKVILPTSEIATIFQTAFNESCTKAARPEIIIKSQQIVPTTS